MDEQVPQEKKSIEQLMCELNRSYVEGLLTLLTYTDLKELNYSKTSIKLDNGGVYLLSFLHVQGPKIEFTEQRGVDVLGVVIP